MTVPDEDLYEQGVFPSIFNRDHRRPRFDQTLSPVSESAIEFIVRKRRPEEVAAAGRLPPQQQPSPSLRLHFNQYRDDQKTLRAANPAKPPFLNEAEL